MQLRTLLITGVVLSFGILLAAGLHLIQVSQAYERFSRYELLTTEINSGMNELTTVTVDYLLYFSQRAKEQWLARYQSLTPKIVAYASLSNDPEHQQLLNLYQKLEPLFGHTVTVHEEPRPADKRSEHQLALVNQLYAITQKIVARTRALSASYHQQQHTLIEKLLMTLFIFFLVMATLITAFWITGTFRIILPIRDLSMRVPEFADNLDYRINASRRDEIGDLGDAFNRMAKRIRRSMVKAEVLSREVESHRRTEQKLIQQIERYELVTEGAHDAIWDWDVPNRRIYLSPRWYELRGLTKRNPTDYEDEWLSGIHPDDSDRVRQAIDTHLRGESPFFQEEYQVQCLDGSWKWVLNCGIARRDTTGQVIRMAGSETDITERKNHEEYLLLSSSVFENTGEGVLITDAESNIIEVNNAFTKLLGFSRKEIIGQKPSMLKSGRHDESFYRDMWKSLNTTGMWRGEIWNRHKSGANYPQLATISRVCNSNGVVTHYVSVFSDITQIIEAQEELDYLAHHDALTNLPNRLLLNERLEQAIRNAQRQNKNLALFFLDLNHFKHINDSIGHTAGDHLLQQVATKLAQLLRQNDTVARIHGDEFVFLLESIAKPQFASSVAEKLLNIFAEPFIHGNTEIHLTASMGICIYPTDGKDAATLLRNADTALNRAKLEGANTYQYYTEQFTRHAQRRIFLENGLREAPHQGQMTLAYQPQVDLKTAHTVGLEVLARWRHPEEGFISPAEFIPLAEETGQIHTLSEWVLFTACAQGAAWLDKGLDFGRLAINLSGKQIERGGLPSLIQDVLRQTGFPPSRLELEITEGFIMQQANMAIDQLTQLQQMGITLAIDDFGTGYSSLSYLKRLPVHILKIDQSFVRDIPDDVNDMAISEAIVALGFALDLTIIAEGIETEAQSQFLTNIGCHTGQGYLYSKPLAPLQCEAFIINKAGGQVG